MSRSQQRRVTRLWTLAGPRAACAARAQQHLDDERAVGALAKDLAERLVRQEDPEWLDAEAARLTTEADRLEGSGIDDDAPEPALTEADVPDRRSSDSGAASRVVAPIDGCRRCQHDVKSRLGVDVDRLAARLYQNVRQQRLDPHYLGQEAQTLTQRADALRTPEPA
jgi:hypothetical protein